MHKFLLSNFSTHSFLTNFDEVLLDIQCPVRYQIKYPDKLNYRPARISGAPLEIILFHKGGRKKVLFLVVRPLMYSIYIDRKISIILLQGGPVTSIKVSSLFVYCMSRK